MPENFSPHSYEAAWNEIEVEEAFTKCTPWIRDLAKTAFKRGFEEASKRQCGPNGEWNAAMAAAAKLLRDNADACTPGSAAEEQNWPFCLESMARELDKMKRTDATHDEGSK